MFTLLGLDQTAFGMENTMRYWRMAMREGNRGKDRFPDCCDRGIAAIDYWDEYGQRVVTDCRLLTVEQFKERWRKKKPRSGTAQASLLHLWQDMKKGDIIYVKTGTQVIGKGRIVHEYAYDPKILHDTSEGEDWAHYVKVDWERDFIPFSFSFDAPQCTILELKDSRLEAVIKAENAAATTDRKVLSPESEPIQSQSNSFITSRGFVLPSSGDELADFVWFNMWQRQLWPYNTLKDGDTLYWYDSTDQIIAWKTTVSDVDKFEYKNKDEMRQRLLKRFGENPVNDPYYVKAPDHGYCLAYKVTPEKKFSLAKPKDYKFPQIGWLRCSDPEAQTWLSSVDADGVYAPILRQSASKIKEEGYFEPSTLEDERERKQREIVQRRGQPEFRNKLIVAYNSRCAVTGCDAVSALEAAHITPYQGPKSNHVSNGLLLRADIHILFDLNLIRIDPESLDVVVAEQLHGTCYDELDGQKLVAPNDDTLQPSKEALEQRRQEFEEALTRI